MSYFIPQFHFEPAADKLKPEWANKVINYYWYNMLLVNLLDGKNVTEIDGFSNGNYDLTPFKKIFKSLRKQEAARRNGSIPAQDIALMDTTGLQWDRVPLIVPKLNSAIATIQKIPIEITCSCQDPLAQKHKQEDLEFLKNKPEMEAVVQPLYDSMNLGKVDMGATEHSSVPYTKLPMDLNADSEEEFKVFAELVYNLAPESSFEAVLQQFYDFKKVAQIKMLEIRDQLKYGVSVNRGFGDKNTGFPNIEYEHPGSVWTNSSMLPDHSDDIIRVIDRWVTPLELFKYFPNEICDLDMLERIVNFSGRGDGLGVLSTGYAIANAGNRIERDKWDTYKMNLKYIEIKSVDNAMIAKKPKSGYRYFTDDEKKCTDKIWAQNTYCFYWLWNTKNFFGQDRLGFAHRDKGKEIYTGFTSNIYKSQQKSAVELCIGENKKAQIADIKLQHTLIKSAPEGKVIDMKYIRNAIEGLTEEMKGTSVKDLLDKAIEDNIHVIDSEGFEGKQIGQYTPVRDLPGGLKDSILGYYRVIAEANSKIAMYTGINEQLTGQSANPEGLIGLQKLLINSSINALNYINEAIISQYQNLFNTWAWYIQDSIKQGGKVKEGIINLIGTNKVNIIKGLNEVPVHQIGIKISLGQREEERAIFKAEVNKMRQAGVLNAADEYWILNTPNPKDAMWLIAVKEIKFQKKQEEAAARQQQMLMQVKQQEGQNNIANTQAKSQGDLAGIKTQGEVDAQLMQLGNQLGLSTKQIDGLIKAKLQDDRIDKQTEKSIKTIYANENAKAQQPLV